MITLSLSLVALAAGLSIGVWVGVLTRSIWFKPEVRMIEKESPNLEVSTGVVHLTDRYEERMAKELEEQ